MTHAGAVEEPIQVSHSDQQMLFTSVSPWGDSGQQMTGAEASEGGQDRLRPMHATSAS